MHCNLSLVIGALAAMAWPRETSAAPASPPVEDTLVVALSESPPFVIREADGGYSGISVELWRSIAELEQLNYRFEAVELADLFTGIVDGRFAAGVGAPTVTAEREKLVDFTHPFYTAGLGIAVGPRAQAGWIDTIRGALSRELLQALGALVVVLLLSGSLLWFFERRRNPEQFGGSVVRGLGEGFWWSAVTMTTVGYGDRAPITWGGRFVALVWMFASVITISGFTAAIASKLTLDQLSSQISGPADLPRFKVASVRGSTSEAYLTERGVAVGTFPELPLALESVSAGGHGVAVHDAPILRYWVSSRFAGDIDVLPIEFEEQQYALVVPERSPLRERLNRRILEVVDSDRFNRVVQSYLGD